MPHLFTPLPMRTLELRNRIAVSPMCEYSSRDGYANDWHLVHLGSRAVGGAALVFTEATAVEARGRISPDDLGIWSDDHIPQLAQITAFVRGQGAVAGMQLAHAGRKASTAAPWKGGKPLPAPEGGWPIVAPSPIPFAAGYAEPEALTPADIAAIVAAFAAAAARAWRAGFQVAEIHAAHGYLIHQFLSPLSNRRTDGYGGRLENRMRFAEEVAAAVRAAWPETHPLWVRISATDWESGGWNLEQSIALAARLKALGVDCIDCSSGGTTPRPAIPLGPGYQTPFAAAIRRQAGVATAAVGMITEPAQADQIVRNGDADMVLLARELLRQPYWPLQAAHSLGHDIPWPHQYQRAKR